MTIIPALLFHSASSSSLSHGWSVSHQSFFKMKLYVGIISPMLIPEQLSCDLLVDLFVFFWPHQFTNFIALVGQRRYMNSQRPLCVYDEVRGWKGDLSRQQICFFSLQTSSKQAINRGDSERPWQSLWFWFTPMPIKKNKKKNKLGHTTRNKSH